MVRVDKGLTLTGGHDEGQEATAQEESTAPSQPPPPRSTSFHLASQISNLATKSEIAHLRQFMVEQFHLLQATLLSKLESMDSRLQACKTHLIRHPRSSSVPPPSSQDPKGKAPMVSLALSPIASPAPAPHISSPQPSPSAQKSPSHDPIASLPTPPHPLPPTRSNSNLLPAPQPHLPLHPPHPVPRILTPHPLIQPVFSPPHLLPQPHLLLLLLLLKFHLPPHLVLLRLRISDGRKLCRSQALPPLRHHHSFFLALFV